MKLSELTAILREIRVSPVKSLGQNFLHDQNLARAIVDAAHVSADDFVVEVGPGLGALTKFILEKGARVLALEKDARLAEFLRREFRGQSRLELRHMDALDFDVRELFAHRNVKLIANLPYYISSQLVLRFLEFPSPISLSLLMLQKEMAHRLAAAPGTSEYGALSIRLQHDYRIELLRTVPHTVFVPEPDIDSAVVRITPRAATGSAAIDREMFHRFVRAGFSQRRKQLRKLVELTGDEWAAATDETGIGATARAEELSLEEWVKLTNIVQQIRAPQASAGPDEMFAVVDANDLEIAAAPRSEVHANNLRHRAVHMLIFNEDGEVLLQKRSGTKDRHPLQWDSSAAGHVDAGEDYPQAAARELLEELGVEAALVEIGRLPPSDATGHEFIRVYTATHNGPFRADPFEIEWTGFFRKRLVTDWIRARPEDFAPGFVECWRLYCSRLNA